MSNKIKKNLSEREFTDDDDFIESSSTQPIDTKQLTEVVKQPRQTYSISFRIDYVEPEESEIELDFYPTPSTTDIITKLVKKFPHLEKIKHRIKILRTNPIRKKDYGTK